jgi:hypothetical protein
MPYAGWAIMRTGWGPQDSYLLFDAGPYGSGHQHEDKLHLILHANGKTLLADPGNYSYDASDWRRYVLSTRAHNTVLVDVLEQNRARARDTWVAKEPTTSPWVTGEGFDYAEGTYADGYGPDGDRTVTHVRQVLFVKPRYWIVIDVLSPADDKPHAYDAPFHLDVESAEMDPQTLATVGRSGDAGLAIIPLSRDGLTAQIVQGQAEPVVQGWMPTGRHDELRPIPTPIYHTEGPGERVMAYVLLPLGGGDPLPQVTALPAPEGTLACAIRWLDGSVHYLAHNPGEKPIALGPVQAEGGLTVAAVSPGGTVERLFRHRS